MGQANGIQALNRSRQVIALCGDGGFNMLMCEFLTAVHHKLPVKVVVYNNSAFGLIKGMLSTLQTDVQALKDPTLYSSRTAQTSDSTLGTASAAAITIFEMILLVFMRSP